MSSRHGKDAYRRTKIYKVFNFKTSPLIEINEYIENPTKLKNVLGDNLFLKSD